MTPPTWRTGGVATGSNTSSLDVPLTSAHVGDYALIVADANNGDSPNVGGGGVWSFITSFSNAWVVWGAVLTDNTGNATVAFKDGGNLDHAAIYGFFPGGGTAVGLAPSAWTGTSTTDVAIPTVASLWDDNLLVGIGFASGSVTWSVPAGWTSRETSLPGDSSSAILATSAASIAARTLTDTATFTASASANTAGIAILVSPTLVKTTASATIDLTATVNVSTHAILPDRPRLIYEIAIASDPNTSDPPVWSDVSDRAQGFSSTRGRQYELTQANAGQGSLLLRNDDGALDPTNTGGVFYPNLLPMRRCRATAIWKGIAYPVWSGYVWSWPQTWTDAMFAQDPTSTIDAIGTLNGGMLPVIAAAMKASDPWHLWPLSETPQTPTSGSAIWQFVDEGATTGSLELTFTSPGNGATVTNGAALPITQAGAAADSSEGIEIACGVGNANLTAVTGAATDSVSLFPKSGEIVTWEWFGASADANTQSAHAVLIAVNDGTTEWLRVETFESSVQFAQIHVYDGTNSFVWPPAPTVGDATNLQRGVSRHWVITLDGTGGMLTITVILDGTIALRQVVLPFNLPTSNITGLSLPGSTISATRGVCFVSAAAMYKRYLGSAEIAEHRAAYGGHPNDTTGKRFTRLLSWADWNSPSSADAGTSTMQPAAGLGGSTLQSQLQQCCDTDFGQMFPDSTGTLVFAGRSRLSDTAPVCTFGDGAGEIPVQTNLTFSNDPTYVYDRVVVSRNNGTTATAKNPAATKKYFPNELDVTVYSTTDADAFGQANYLASQYGDVQRRVDTVTVDMYALCRADHVNSTDWAATVLGLEISDVVTVTRRLPTTVTGDFRIQQIADSITPTGWVRQFQMSPVMDAPTW